MGTPSMFCLWGIFVSDALQPFSISKCLFYGQLTRMSLIVDDVGHLYLMVDKFYPVLKVCCRPFVVAIQGNLCY
jgi:hypothetical protein